MAIIRAIQGQSVTVEAWFHNTDGTPLLPISGYPAQFSMRDFNGSLIASGSATQDSGDSSRWFSTVVIPMTAPISSTGLQKYRLDWSLPSSSGTHTATELFEVWPAGDPVRQLFDNDVIMLDKGPFSDTLYVETNGVPAVTSVTIAIVDELGNSLLLPTSVTATSGLTVGTMQGYTYSAAPLAIPNLACTNVVQAFCAIWSITSADGSVNFEMHPIYVINPALMIYMNKVKQLVDRAQLGDVHPYLAIKPVDLVHHLFRGIEVVSTAPPNASTPINPLFIPGMLSDFIVKAAAVSLLQAQMLAEGMSNFDFQGLGVSLNVDRTPIIDNLIQQFKQDLGDPLRVSKGNWIRAGCPAGPIGAQAGRSPYNNRAGVLNVTYGSYFNYESTAMLSGFGGNSWFGGMGLLNMQRINPYMIY